MKLSELQIKQSGIIKNMGDLKASFVSRLMDMGIYPHAHITLLNKMARGKMIVVEVDDVEICLRKTDAERIELL